MMSGPLIRKTFRDYLPLTMGAAGLLLAFAVLFMFAVHSIPADQTRDWLKLEWIRSLIASLLGADLLESFTPTGFASFVFTHPMTWMVVVAYVFAIGSGVLSGEIDRGTMDLLATLPISRGGIYVSLTVVVLASGLPVCGAVWLGTFCGRALVGDPEIDMAVLGLVVCHLYAVYVFLSCLSIAVSALCDRRSSALTICFVVFFYSFVLNVLAGLWPAIQKIAFTGFLHYYAPLPIVRDRAWQWGDLAVLITAGAALWIVGLVGFSRRDVPAR